MQQFTVPQFIDVEDKIIGPITSRQFIILLVGFILIGICYKLFDFSFFLTVAILILIICGLFSFIKVNGRPFHFFLLNIIQTFKRSNLRVWNNNVFIQNEEKGINKITVNKTEIPENIKSQPRASRLAELSLIVDTRGVYRGNERE